MSLSDVAGKTLRERLGFFAAIIAVVRFVRDFALGPAQFNSFRELVLLLALATLSAMELGVRDAEDQGTGQAATASRRYFAVPRNYAIALCLFCAGLMVYHRSTAEAVSALGGGFLAFLILLTIDRAVARWTDDRGFDGGTLVAAWIAGLLVGLSRVVPMLFVMFLSGSLIAIILMRTSPRRNDIASVPLLIIGAVFVTSPFYAPVIAWQTKSLEPREEIAEITATISRSKDGESQYHRTNNRLTVTAYDRSGALSVQQLSKYYSSVTPVITFSWWKTLRGQGMFQLSPDKIFVDNRTGVVFAVRRPLQQEDRVRVILGIVTAIGLWILITVGFAYHGMDKLAASGIVLSAINKTCLSLGALLIFIGVSLWVTLTVWWLDSDALTHVAVYLLEIIAGCGLMWLARRQYLRRTREAECQP